MTWLVFLAAMAILQIIQRRGQAAPRKPVAWSVTEFTAPDEEEEESP